MHRGVDGFLVTSLRALYLIVEGNDPTGYKSNQAIGARGELGIRANQFPKYPPDRSADRDRPRPAATIRDRPRLAAIGRD